MEERGLLSPALKEQINCSCMESLRLNNPADAQFKHLRTPFCVWLLCLGG